MPMFPLGTVLLPSMVLPLHVFEPRYRQMTQAKVVTSRWPDPHHRGVNLGFPQMK